jgi:Putative zincin peptidase
MEETSFLPEGYHFVSQYRYPRKILYITELLPPFAALSFYPIGYWGLIDGGSFRGVAGFQGVVRLEAEIFIIMTILSTQVVHGLIKRGISHLLGYDISFLTLFMFLLEPTFAASSEQFQPRRDALLIAIAPLSLFIFLLVSLVLEPHEIISYMIAIFLLVNLSGTACDFYFVCWLLRKPKGSVLYVESCQTLFLFEPLPGRK